MSICTEDVNELVISEPETNKILTKKQKNRIVRNRISMNDPYLVKWFAKQVKVNELVRFEFEWRSRYFPKVRELLSPEFIMSLKHSKST